MTIEEQLITACLTIIGGALTLVFGQVLVDGFLRPALELKQEIGKIAHSLIFYANRRYCVGPEEQQRTREAFRTHACRLQELLNMITGYLFWRFILFLPGRKQIIEASRCLIGHSNFPAKQDGGTYDQATEIRKLLRIVS